MPKNQRGHLGSRQRPVSCGFCRTRKLRCSRIAPCSNCVARGITCDLELPPAFPDSAVRTSDNSEILERLRRLESLLLAQKGVEQRNVDQFSNTTATKPQFVSLPAFSPQTQDVETEKGVTWLDTDSLNQIPLTQLPRNHIVFKICPVGQVIKAPSYVCVNQPAPHYMTNCEITRCIWLPPRVEAQILLEKFTRVAHHLPFVTHIPTLHSVLETIYAGWTRNCLIQPGPVILLLSIFAAATHFWGQSDCAGGVFSSPGEANNQALVWTEAAEYVLNTAYRSCKVSIEGVQGSIIVGFIAAHIDGLRRYRLLFATSAVLARDSGLHRIDHPSHASIGKTAQAEIGRRIWWYLCSSDWAMAARVGGMVEGIYSCHPRQMITKRPLNINDEDISDETVGEGRPLSQPTIMSYTMQRVRLAEVSRGIVDRAPLAMAHNSRLSYDAVMNIDTELQAFINEVPAFFSVSKSVLCETYRLTQTQANVIVFQGRVVYILLYSQRCKLHIPYVARVSEDPAYYLSREICIRYARLVIQSEIWQENSGLENELRFKFSDLLTSVFSACVVLLVDLFVNPSSPQYNKQREEVKKSFQLLGAAKDESESTAKLVSSLVHILRKYNAGPLSPVPSYREERSPTGRSDKQHSHAMPNREMVFDNSDVPIYEDGIQTAFTGGSHDPMDVNDDLNLAMDIERAQMEGEYDLSSYWMNLTQDFEQGVDLGSFDWDGIFSELDSSFL